MFKGITLRTFPPELDWRECISLAASAGFDSVELNLDGRLELNASDSLLTEIKKYAQSNNIKLDSVYSRRQWATPPEVAKALSETGYNLSVTSEVLPPYKYHPEHLWESVGKRIDSLIGDIVV
jgi:hypothetical protein